MSLKVITIVSMATALYMLQASRVEGGRSSLATDDDISILKSYFGCSPCDPTMCPPRSRPDCELVRQPGVCGCCLRCALTVGQSCGVYKDMCGRGLRCLPPSGESEGMSALIQGRGTCTLATATAE